ncbi:MAG: hypothetical protein IPM77_01670 [Crocinitomicaceae bacterium]|nr:hypothetical protein [Crocinitomicaceae bacterium]
MRADLHTMEQIDLYLQGKLQGSELSQFQNQLAINPELQSLVNDQQLLIQTVSRKALLAEINAVAGIGGTAWYANPWVGIGGAALVIGGITAAVYFSSDNNPEINEQSEIITQNFDSTLVEDTIVEDGTTYFVMEDGERIVPDIPQNKHLVNNTINEENNSSNQYNPAEESAQNLNYTNENNSYVTSTPDDVQTSDKNETRDLNRIASYPKGDVALNSFINENMRFPGTSKEKKISGNVKVTFLVTSEGTRTNIESTCFNLRDENDKPMNSTQMVLNQKIANLFEREAERVVRIMPVWIPATDSQGNSVLSAQELYFNFSLKNGNSVYRLD